MKRDDDGGGGQVLTPLSSSALRPARVRNAPVTGKSVAGSLIEFVALVRVLAGVQRAALDVRALVEVLPGHARVALPRLDLTARALGRRDGVGAGTGSRDEAAGPPGAPGAPGAGAGQGGIDDFLLETKGRIKGLKIENGRKN